MRRLTLVIALFATIGSLLVTTHASAATEPIDVEVRGTQVSPETLIAHDGDTIRFHFTDGLHHLQSYATIGHLNPDSSRGIATTLDTNDVNASNGEVFFPLQFHGGTLRYMDVRFAKMDPANGVCNGMCAVITDEDTTPQAPVVDQPTQVIQERPATISGTAEPLTLVTLAEGTSYDNGSKYQGQALTDATGVWKVKTVDFGTINGDKPLVAKAIRGVGYVSPGSQPAVVYHYIYDRNPPDVTFDAPFPVAINEVVLTGTAHDTVNVKQVIVEFDRQDAAANAQHPNPVVQKFWAADCQPACPAQQVNWKLDIAVVEPNAYTQVGSTKVALLAGLYTVKVTAYDTSNNQTSALAPTFGGTGLFLFVNTGAVAIPQASPSGSPVAVPSNTIVPSPTITPTP